MIKPLITNMRARYKQILSLVWIGFCVILSASCTSSEPAELVDAGFYMEAIEIYKQRLSRSAESFELHYGMAMAQSALSMHKQQIGIARSDDWFEPLYHFLRAMNGASTDEQLQQTREKTAIIHYNFATLFNREKNTTMALYHLEQAVQLDSTFLKALNLYGTIEHMQGNLEKAAHLYQRIVELNNEYVLAHFNLGAVYWALKQYAQAHEHFSQAMQLQPQNELFATWVEKSAQQAQN